MQEFYKRLVARGCKVALVAVMRKLVALADVLILRGSPLDSQASELQGSTAARQQAAGLLVAVPDHVKKIKDFPYLT